MQPMAMKAVMAPPKNLFPPMNLPAETTTNAIAKFRAKAMGQRPSAFTIAAATMPMTTDAMVALVPSVMNQGTNGEMGR